MLEPRIVLRSQGDNPPKAALYYGQTVIETLKSLPDASVQTVITSPPYWGLRDYGATPVVWGGDPNCNHHWSEEMIVKGPSQAQGSTSVRKGRSNVEEQSMHGVSQGSFCWCGAWLGSLGQEPSPDLFVEHLVMVFREAARVLKDDGTLWLNLGDSYANDSKWGGATGGKHVSALHGQTSIGRDRKFTGLNGKNLIGIPWRVALALQADGWILRSDIIWSKNNPMPESVTDRPTKAHEYVFLFSKQPDYFYNAEAVREPASDNKAGGKPSSTFGGQKRESFQPHHGNLGASADQTRNRRSVWRISTQPYTGAHFAAWPSDLVTPMVLAGSSARDTVLDPFSGSATTGMVAMQLDRDYIGIDLNAEYLPLAEARLLELPPPVIDDTGENLIEMFEE